MIKFAILFRLFDYSLFHVINWMPPLWKAPILGHETLTVPILEKILALHKQNTLGKWEIDVLVFFLSVKVQRFLY